MQRKKFVSQFAREMSSLWSFSFLLAVSRVIAQDPNPPRVDCYPEPGVTQDLCTGRKCLWDGTDYTKKTNAPKCYLPPNTGYNLDSINGNTYVLKRVVSDINPGNFYQQEITPLNLITKYYGKILNVRIGNDGRYEPPIGAPKQSGSSSDALQFSSTTTVGNVFSFKVTRQSTGSTLWDTSIGGLMFADQYIQIAAQLQTNVTIHGFGEHVHQSLTHDTSRYTTWPMFARDEGPDSLSTLSTRNLYGVHPFYLGLESVTGKAYGVLFLNSNAQEVTVGTGPHLVYRTIGGMLDIYFFPGPTPGEVISQYLGFIGLPFMPAYWALGFQLCRWGYANLTEMQDAVERTRNAKIPLDVPYADIDYMDKDKDFTEAWDGFDDYVKQLRSQGLHVILIFDPAIEADYNSFNRSESSNVSYVDWPSHDYVPSQIEDSYPMIKDKNMMLGNVWTGGNAAFPDFLDTGDATTQWWTNEFIAFHNKCPFDGVWIDMNEPSNFNTGVYNRTAQQLTPPAQAGFYLSCPIGSNYTLDDPPYSTWAVYLSNSQGANPKEYLSTKTLCMIGRTARGSLSFYDTKNLYGWSEARATDAALKKFKNNARAAIISRSTFVSSGHYAGHWLGDNTARWEDLKTSIIGIQEFNMFGIPYIGADICGFNGNTNEELCLRWHQLGAFYPFSRNHNERDAIKQDPAQWPSVANAARTALTLRYRLLPYLYSLMYSASTSGTTVIRPLFFEYPLDQSALEMSSNQFLWGKAIMIAPIVSPNATRRMVYFPPGFWYGLRTSDYGQLIGSIKGTWESISAPLDDMIPVYLLGSTIVPVQPPDVTTTLSRKNPFGLIIALETTSATSDVASGEMYWDDGESFDNYYRWTLDYRATPTNSTLKITAQKKPATPVAMPTLNTIEIFGYDRNPNLASFRINNLPVSVDSTMLTNIRTTYVKRMQLSVPNFINLSSADTITLYWEHGDFPDVPATTSPTTPQQPGTSSAAFSTPSIFLSSLLLLLISLCRAV